MNTIRQLEAKLYQARHDNHTFLVQELEAEIAVMKCMPANVVSIDKKTRAKKKKTSTKKAA